MGVYPKPKLILGGDTTVYVELGDTIAPEVNRKVRTVLRVLDEAQIPGVIDLLPTYRSIQVYYDPIRISLDQLKANLISLSQQPAQDIYENYKVIEIPVVYGGEFGPDLGHVASHNNLTSARVIELHSSVDYLVYMLGFNTGFPYLGGLPSEIATPRLATPRLRVPAGSVGIADSQTGIYPLQSPGGWQLIGRSPVKMFDPTRDPPVIIGPGDYLRFVSIDEPEYQDIEDQIASGRYSIITSTLR